MLNTGCSAVERRRELCTCSLRRLPLLSVVATFTAVTLVMKDSIGSTVSLVTAMMNASQLAFTCFSSSFLLSTYTVAKVKTETNHKPM